MELIRLTTVHPALVHFSIGALPVILLAYGLARWRRSERWTFVGDVSLIVTAVITLVTAAFGLVAFLTVAWPGGLDLWRWLHLGLGVAATVLLVGLAGYRLRARRRQHHSGLGTFSAALVTSLVILVAGWVGGEVLVFRAGVAVEAAGHGALAPPVAGMGEGEPEDLDSAMGRIRAHWAGSQTTLAQMIVNAPSPEGFAAIASHGRALTELGAWLAAYDQREEDHHHGEPVSEHAGHADQVAGGDGHGHGEMSFAEHLAVMGASFEKKAGEIVEAAEAQDLTDTAARLGETTKLCASCHDELRWGVDHDH